MVELRVQVQCPTCGTPLSSEGGSQGLCPGCLLELALDDTSLEAELEPGEAPTLQFTPDQAFSEGEIQGERYRIRSLLGRGGMGEVWRAYDLKLRLDVALKALRSELIRNPEALETLRQEVRVAREVVSPNVCRVFDLEELDGQDLISMEYVDGTTLQEILKERGPLELNEAREIASQFLAGLEAIHEAGLVHRDIKPENLMLTRTGRVVVMDFGIAKGLGDGKSGLVAGTPAYMAPEQARAGEIDARADLFSAGVVLAEMVEPGGVRSFEDRKRLWEGIHQAEPQISDSPWSKVIARAVSAETCDRFESASALARALEEVTLRAAGDETARPYPGLAAFQQEDAEFFFGRELEVEALWKKLRRPHLLAVIGPSGAGKSSFLRAGLLPTLTDDWQALITTPGTRPFANLARELEPKLGNAPGTQDLLQRIEEPDFAVELLSEWRRQEEHGLVIVDQFEELFTQNTEEIQESFADLLGRLPLETNVHVLLSMRSDFLDHCHGLRALEPILSDLTLLGPPTGASLRRAIVEPALRCGYRFEDETIVDEMLTEVEGERGALPMVAFSAAQLWEKRDRETGLLTKHAYEQIGGVGGSLAQHAESTLDQIGQDHVPIVRELFRNLVTAQGTRAARDREELLSVFADGSAATALASGFASPAVSAAERKPGAPQRPREIAEHVLDRLIDARLLTSYEVPATEDDTAHHRIEIVHESLLSHWPRLVRWQMQDAEGAKLRDELRAQAQLWDQHGRSVDYLWTGTAYREYQLWRERYPGGLTTLEEEFTQAMTAHAERRKRRRRIAVATVIVVLLAVLSIVTWSRFEAIAEARRAEAAKLLAIAQLRLETDPTEGLAYATASLELADTEETRVFALKALAEAPPVLVLEGLGFSGLAAHFSPDGRWLAMAGRAEEVLVFHQDGTGPIRLPGHKPSTRGDVGAAWYQNRFLVTGHFLEGRVRLWSIPDGKVLREIEIGRMVGWPGWQVGETHLFAEVVEVDTNTGHELRHLRSWRLPDGEVEDLGTVDWTVLGARPAAHFMTSGFDTSGRNWLYIKGSDVFRRLLPLQNNSSDRSVGAHEDEPEFVWWLTAAPGQVWTWDPGAAELRLWDLSGSDHQPLKSVSRPGEREKSIWDLPDASARWLATPGEGGIRLWDLENWQGNEPLHLRKRANWYASAAHFHPQSRWLVASTEYWDQLVFWPLPRRSPIVVDEYATGIFRPLAFSPDSRFLATHWSDRSLRLWPIPGGLGKSARVLHAGGVPASPKRLTFDADGERLVGTGGGPNLFVASLDGGRLQKLEGFSHDHLVCSGAFSPSGTFVAAGTVFVGTGIEKTLRVWNLETGDVRQFDLEQTKVPKPPGPEGPAPEGGHEGGIWNLVFTDESTLYTAGGDDTGVLRWDLEAGSWERIVSAKPGQDSSLWLSGDRQQLITRLHLFPTSECGPGERTPLVLHSLRAGSAKNLPTVVECTDFPLAFDSSLTVYVAGQADGTLRIGRIGGDRPHLLAGHDGRIDDLAISPDLRWIASSGEDNTLRLWPMPDLDKPPLHTLPREELLAKLKSLTNLRAVRDQASSTGWSIEIGPFPGWQEVPTW